MQSEPTEVPSNELSGQPSLTQSLAQHGSHHDSFSDSSSIRPNVEYVPDSEVDTLSSISDESIRGRRASSRGLSSHHSSQRGSPVDRIFQHEKINTLSKRKQTRLEFQVVPSASGVAPRISIDDFPNGWFDVQQDSTRAN